MALARFDMSGHIVCWEVNHGDPPTQVIDPPGKGIFQLTQNTVLQEYPAGIFVTGFNFVETGTCSGGVAGCERTWTFTNGIGAKLLYELVPVDPIAHQIAANSGCNTGYNEVCKVYFGLEDSSSPSGEVIRYATKTTTVGLNVLELPFGEPTWALCHNQAFSAVRTFDVYAKNHSSTGGTPLNTYIYVTQSTNLIVSAKPTDLWSAGALKPLASYSPSYKTWSNANGIDGPDLFATGSDDSGMSAGTLIGSDIFGDWMQNYKTFPFGTLVGKVGSTFFRLGTDFDGSPPYSGTLKLVYWDKYKNDNIGSVKVQVLKDKPILCTADAQSAQVEERIIATLDGPKIEMRAEPTLNVSNESTTAVIPIVIFGCNTPDYPTFGPGGNVVIGDKVIVNNVPVKVERYSLEDNNSCDGTPVPDGLPDLHLKLNRFEFIQTFLNSGSPACMNGENPWSLAVNMNGGGFFVGTDTILLNQCQ
jgi:hypothetical protein